MLVVGLHLEEIDGLRLWALRVFGIRQVNVAEHLVRVIIEQEMEVHPATGAAPYRTTNSVVIRF